MQTGTSLFLIAVGAILRFAVNDNVKDVDLSTVGLILIIVGIVGFVYSLLALAMWRSRREEIVRDRYVERY